MATGIPKPQLKTEDYYDPKDKIEYRKYEKALKKQIKQKHKVTKLKKKKEQSFGVKVVKNLFLIVCALALLEIGIILFKSILLTI